jgi:hypothetical protein
MMKVRRMILTRIGVWLVLVGCLCYKLKDNPPEDFVVRPAEDSDKDTRDRKFVQTLRVERWLLDRQENATAFTLGGLLAFWLAFR